MSNLVTHAPKALRHYREQLSLSVELFAKKTGIKVDKIIKGENDNQVFTSRQLQSIAKVLLVPEFLLLSNKLETKDIPTTIDYRNHHDNNDENARYLLQKTLHELAQNREDLLYTYDNIDVVPTRFGLSISGHHAIDDAHAIREFLQIDKAKLTLDNSDDYYHAWRNLLEIKDILVLEISRTDIGSDGLALYYDTLPIIGIIATGQSNSRKLFTMMHELVHLGLRQSAIDGRILDSTMDIERYCNLVAGYVLLPQHILDRLFRPHLSVSDNVDIIRQHTKVSRQAIAIQLKLTGKINQTELNAYLAELEHKSSGFGKLGKQYTAYNHFGKLYIQQILSATMDDSISVSSAMNILHLNDISQLHYLEQKVFA